MEGNSDEPEQLLKDLTIKLDDFQWSVFKSLGEEPRHDQSIIMLLGAVNELIAAVSAISKVVFDRDDVKAAYISDMLQCQNHIAEAGKYMTISALAAKGVKIK